MALAILSFSLAIMYEPNALAVMMEALMEHPDFGLDYADSTEINGLNGKIWYSREKGPCGEPSELPVFNNIGACFLYQRWMYTNQIPDYWSYWINDANIDTVYWVPVIIST